MSKEAMGPKPQKMRCKDCGETILQGDPKQCPYCGSANLIPKEEVDLEEIEKLERAGRYEDAALRYEEVEMWDKAGEERRKSKTSYVISANISIGKVGAISMECPHCGASQPLASKNSEVTCKYCGKNYVIPKKVLELL